MRVITIDVADALTLLLVAYLDYRFSGLFLGFMKGATK